MQHTADDINHPIRVYPILSQMRYGDGNRGVTERNQTLVLLTMTLANYCVSSLLDHSQYYGPFISVWMKHGGKQIGCKTQTLSLNLVPR